MGGGPVAETLLFVSFNEEPVEILDSIRKEFPHIEVIFYRTSRALPGQWMAAAETVPAELWKKATVLITLAHLPTSKDLVPNLKLIHLISAGVDHLITHPLYTDSDITITTSSGIHGPPIAEWVVLHSLALSRKYDFFYEAQKKQQWSRDASNIWTISDNAGKRLGVLGYGSIGRQVSNVCRAMGMDVIAFTASPKDSPESRKDHGYIVPGTGDPDGLVPRKWFSGKTKEDLHHFLSQDIDILLVSVPLTKATTHLLSTPEFEVLKKHKKPLIVNISRGKIIDQVALVTALKAGDVRGAALDVTDPEPLPPGHELWDAPNTSITPHISGLGREYQERSLDVLKTNLRRWDGNSEGRGLINVVNRRQGY